MTEELVNASEEQNTQLLLCQPEEQHTQFTQTGRQSRAGVVYISRIPPHMKPAKLRHLLEQHGAVTRVYCAPEDPGVRAKRKKLAKDTGKNFTEGWVEFEDRKVAKRVAEMLNGTPMGGRRRNAYHYDLWNLKYLRKFAWHHLTEEIAYERAVREQKMAAELRAAKKERDFYLTQVNKAKAVEAIQKRRAAVAAADVAQPATPPTATGQAAVQRSAATHESNPIDRTASGDARPVPDSVAGLSTGVAVTGSSLRHSKQPQKHGGQHHGHSAKHNGMEAVPGVPVKRRYGQRPVKQDPSTAGVATLDESLLSLLAGA